MEDRYEGELTNPLTLNLCLNLDYQKLSKKVSYALRHAPWEYELVMDSEGWVAIERLMQALRSKEQWDGQSVPIKDEGEEPIEEIEVGDKVLALILSDTINFTVADYQRYYVTDIGFG
ncbi:RNA 2'-phosphotransferase [Paenibacillus arenilitoris]|uniref:RNA 2'-phosphotransferase n=1 Tax=Paenibacillus arenilitoris TaxID=2772299 RepID=A0A927H7N7_9BACL|nr:RNA 2'-phosphotransferase [Paenibacillus arenilitoris]